MSADSSVIADALLEQGADAVAVQLATQDRAFALKLAHALMRAARIGTPRTVIESPYAGDITNNETYLRRALRDSLRRGEAPFASHAIYTQPGVLDDTDPADRAMGILAGFAWRYAADQTVVYGDRGVSGGMEKGIEHAKTIGCPITYRTLDP